MKEEQPRPPDQPLLSRWLKLFSEDRDEQVLAESGALGLGTAALKVLENLAHLLFEQGRRDESILVMRELVRRCEDRPEPHNLLGSLLSLCGRAEEAEAEFRLAADLAMGSPKYLTNLALCLAGRSEWLEVDSLLRRLGRLGAVQGNGKLERLARECRDRLGGARTDPGEIWPRNRPGRRVLIMYPLGWFIEECCVRRQDDAIPAAALTLSAYLNKLGHNAAVLAYGPRGRVIPDADAVIFFAPWSRFNSVAAPAVRAVKALQPRTSTVLIMYESLQGWEQEAMLACPELDYAILPHEKELSAGDIVAHGEPRAPGGFGPKSGILYRDETGRPVSDGNRPFGRDLHHLPYIGEEIERYARLNPFTAHWRPYVPLQRGCPHGCTYCPQRRTAARYRSAEDIADEFEYLNRNYKVFSTIALEVMRDPLEVDHLCEMLLSRGLIINGGSLGVRCEYVRDVELLKKLRRVGFNQLYFGVEAATEEMRRRLKKNFSDDDLFGALELTARAGLSCTLSFITGLPWEDRGYYEYFSKYLEKLCGFPEVWHVNVAKIVPYPGLPLTTDMVEAGVIPRDYSFEEWNSGLRGHQYHTLHLDPEDYESCLRGILTQLEESGRR